MTIPLLQKNLSLIIFKYLISKSKLQILKNVIFLFDSLFKSESK